VARSLDRVTHPDRRPPASARSVESILNHPTYSNWASTECHQDA
jgi:hypothetical protein